MTSTSYAELWSEKLGKTVQVEQPNVAKVQITGKPYICLMKQHTSYFAASWVWRMRKSQGFANRIKN